MMFDENEILYPRFLKCCKFAKNTHHGTILENLANGVLPSSNFEFQGGEDGTLIIYKRSPSVSSLSIPVTHDDYSSLYNEIISFLDIPSHDENNTNNKVDWNDMKKNSRYLLIHQFVKNASDTYNLPSEKMQSLLVLLKNCIEFKTIETLVTLDEETHTRIEKIQNLTLFDGGYTYSGDVYGIKNTHPPPSSSHPIHNLCSIPKQYNTTTTTSSKKNMRSLWNEIINNRYKKK